MLLKDYLHLHKMPQREFARRTGITEPTLSRIIRHPERITFKLARKIHHATDGQVSFLDWPDGIHVEEQP